MFVTLFHIHIKPDHVADFIESMRLNHEQSVLEPGNLRFDVLQSADDPTRFVTYMAYRDEAGLNAHREAAHYLAWRDEVAPWMAEPRLGVGYRGLFPAAPEPLG
jgi:(4S)-4-hydroxy-5-phosphonooxypentane-2,3-dione isomerase